MPSVTVVIPAYNAERFLAPAIESVLAQTHSAAQLLIVDDGSTDGTAAVADAFGSRVRRLTQPNSGVAASRNRGAAAASGEWIAFLDADDLWRPQKLERQLAAAADTSADAVFCGLEQVDIGGASLGVAPKPSLELRPLLLHTDDVPQGTSSTMLVRRAAFDAVGRYDERLATMADWDMLIRLRLRGEFAYVDEPLALYRRYPGSMSRDVSMLNRESRLVIDKTFSNAELPQRFLFLRRKCMAWNDLVLSGSHYHAGQTRVAIRLALQAMLRDPAVLARLLGFPFRMLSRKRTFALRER